MPGAPLDEARLWALFGATAHGFSSDAGEGEEQQAAPRKSPCRGALQHPAAPAGRGAVPRQLSSDSEEALLQHAAPRWASPARASPPAGQPVFCGGMALPRCAIGRASRGRGSRCSDDEAVERVQRGAPPSSSSDEEGSRTPQWLRWAHREFGGSTSSSASSAAGDSPAFDTSVRHEASPHNGPARASRRPCRSLASEMAAAAVPAGRPAALGGRAVSHPGGDEPLAAALPPLLTLLPLMVPAEAATYFRAVAEAAAAAASPWAAQGLGERGADWRIGAAGAGLAALPVAPLPGVVSADGSPQAWKRVPADSVQAPAATPPALKQQQASFSFGPPRQGGAPAALPPPAQRRRRPLLCQLWCAAAPAVKP